MTASIAGRLPRGQRFDFPVSLARIACISSALFVGACTSEGPLIHKTVNTDEATATVFATRADRRLAYLTGDGHFLAEPSPDAFLLVSTALEVVRLKWVGSITDTPGRSPDGLLRMERL